MAAAKTRQSKIGFPQSRGEREVSAKQKKSLAESQVDVYPPTTSQGNSNLKRNYIIYKNNETYDE